MAKHLVIVLIFLLVSGCQKEIILIEKYESTNSKIYVNVVKKNINLDGVIQGKYSGKLLKFIKNWIDNDIKTDGFEGNLIIQLVSISSDELLINNGIRIQMELEIDFIITKKALDKKNIIKFKGKEFSEITGDFTLNEKEIQINNISKKIIERLSNKILKEIN